MALTAITIEGVSATDNARNITLTNYGTVNKRGRNKIIPHRDGEHSHNPKWFGPTNMMFEVMLKTTPSPEENLSGLIAAFNPAYTTATVVATHPFAGSVTTEVELLRPPVQGGDNPNVYTFPLRNPKGSWQQTTATTTTGNAGTPAAITTTGDTPVDDFTLRFGTTGYVEHTNSVGTVSRFTLTSGASTGVTVDMGARTVLSTTGGDQDAFLTISQDWMRFESGSTQAITATVDHTFVWRSRWAV